jgi:uncharacterized membrane protein
MSAESVINEYLSEEGGTLTLESLQVYVQEGVSIKPLAGLVQFLRQVKSMASIDKVFSTKKNVIRMAAVKAVKAVDDDIFSESEDDDSSSSDNDSPVDEPAPENEREAEGYLKRMYLYFKKVIKGLGFPEMKQVFRAALAVVTKLLMGVGLIGMAVIMPLSIPIALIIVVMCITNAVEQTKDIEDETERINLKQAFNNVMQGFKRMFLSLKINKGEGKFAIISSIIVGVLFWIKSKMHNVQYVFTSIFSHLRAGVVKPGWNLAKQNLAAATDAKLIIGMIMSADTREEVVKAMHQKGIPPERLAAIESQVQNLWDMSPEQRKPHVKKLIRGAVVSGAQKARPLEKEAASKTSKALYWGIVIVGVATILYLFANIVDSYNLKKVKEREDDREEFERTV